MEQKDVDYALDEILARNVQMYEKKIYALRNLIKLGLSLSSNLDFESLVESILYNCMGQLLIEKIAILLQTDIDEDNLYVHMAKGYDPSFNTREIVINENSPMVKYMLDHPEPVDYKTLAEKTELQNDVKILNKLSPLLVIPMKSKNSLNGIIILGNRLSDEVYSSDEKEFLKDLTKFAAIAVENSRLYLMATLDRMTRLYIHHYFQERLLEEIKRCSRNDTPLSLIMSDIDHFKKFNDTYGHQQGDTVLKESASIFKKSIRSIDIAARYGGEEFAIILPETEINDAIIIANRLRKGIETHEFSGQDKPLHVTISAGVAQFDKEKDDDKKIFIGRADSALYKAKESGRNKVVAIMTKTDNEGEDS